MGRGGCCPRPPPRERRRRGARALGCCRSGARIGGFVYFPGLLEESRVGVGASPAQPRAAASGLAGSDGARLDASSPGDVQRGDGRWGAGSSGGLPGGGSSLTWVSIVSQSPSEAPGESPLLPGTSLAREGSRAPKVGHPRTSHHPEWGAAHPQFLGAFDFRKPLWISLSHYLSPSLLSWGAVTHSCPLSPIGHLRALVS